MQKTVRDFHRATRQKYSAEEKIHIVIEGLRGEDSIAELCRREGLNANVYYRWSKEFMEAGKKRLALGHKFGGATYIGSHRDKQIRLYPIIKSPANSTLYAVLDSFELGSVFLCPACRQISRRVLS